MLLRACRHAHVGWRVGGGVCGWRALSVTARREAELSKGIVKHLESMVVDQAKIQEELRVVEQEDVVDGQKYDALSRAIAKVEPLTSAYHEYRAAQQGIVELNEMLLEAKQSNDADLQELASAELVEAHDLLKEREKLIFDALLPPLDEDSMDAVVEVRPGVGGAEAGLFAEDLFRMYQMFAVSHGWQANVSSRARGLMSATIKGTGVFGLMKHETGVHRIQRVPKTETQGRVHTSTATVALLPKPTEAVININARDLKIEACRATGAGGQHVNTTDSAVRITHLPTGVVAECQEGRSQHANKARALEVLHARLYDAEQQRLRSERRELRNSQIGTAERSERIRTYNVPQDRVTDHRVGASVTGVTAFFDAENRLLDTLIEKLAQDEHARRVAELTSTFT